MDYQGYNSRWETLIDNRDSVDIVEIVTWNDYGESSYIGPIEGAEPTGTTWTSGFDHTGTFVIYRTSHWVLRYAIPFSRLARDD